MRNSSSILVFAVCFIFLAQGCANKNPLVLQIAGTWDSASTKGLMTHGGHSACEVAGNIYLIGGFSAETPNEDSTTYFCPLVQVFDVAKNIWSTPKTSGTFTPRISLTASVVGGKIYAIGGFSKKGVSDALEVFDPTHNLWSTPATTGHFTPRGNHTACVVNNKIYVMGGLNVDAKLINWVEVFDPATNAWSTLAINEYAGGEYCSSVVVDGKIYLLGGHQGKVNLKRVDVLDLSTNTWTSVEVKGHYTDRCCFISTVIGGKIYSIGGRTDATWPEVVDVFDPATKTWSSPAYQGIFTGRHGLTCTTVNNKIYAIDGGMNGSLVAINQVFTPSP